MQNTVTFSRISKIFPSKYAFMHFALLCIAFLGATSAQAQRSFITTWETDNPGLINNKSIIIPTQGVGYNYEVDWNNDGIFDQSCITGNVTHDFGVPGTYTVRIRGAFPKLRFNGPFQDSKKLLSISQWGI